MIKSGLVLLIKFLRGKKHNKKINTYLVLLFKKPSDENLLKKFNFVKYYKLNWRPQVTFSIAPVFLRVSASGTPTKLSSSIGPSKKLE